MTEEEKIADRIFKLCVLDECDGLWYDRLKAAAIIKHAMAEKDSQLAAEKQRADAAEARAADLESEPRDARIASLTAELDAATREVERLTIGVNAIVARINQPGFEMPSDAIAGALGKLLKGDSNAQ